MLEERKKQTKNNSKIILIKVKNIIIIINFAKAEMANDSIQRTAAAAAIDKYILNECTSIIVNFITTTSAPKQHQ